MENTEGLTAARRDLDFELVTRSERTDSLRRARHEKITGLEGHDATDVCNEGGDIEDHVGGVAVLTDLSIHAALDARSFGIEFGLYERADGAKGVEPFCAGPLTVFLLEVTRCDVAHASVTEDAAESLLRGDVARALAEDDPQLGLVLDPAAGPRQRDLLVRAKEA